MSQLSEYNKKEAKRINNLPDSERGEGGPFLEFDFDGVQYGDNPITEAGYTGRDVWIQYDVDDVFDGWDYFMFPTRLTDDGTIVITDSAVGLMTAEEVYETHTDAPHAETLRPVYDALREVGVRFEYEMTEAEA